MMFSWITPQLCFQPSMAAKSGAMRVGTQSAAAAPGEGDDEPPDLAVEMGPVGDGVPPLASGSASAPREGDSRRSRGDGDSPSRPIDAALLEKVRAIKARETAT